jgi:hypothetical protein
MKITVALSFLLASASAFSPSVQPKGIIRTHLNAEKSASMPFMNRPALLDGSMPGDKGFDPLGLSNIEGVGIDLYWLREAEIKHCRLAMLAVAGTLFVEAFGPAPGCEVATAKCQMDAFWQLWGSSPQYIVFGLIMIGIVEMISGIAASTGRENGIREPGNFSFDPLKLGASPAKMKEYGDKEIENGRLAMWAAAGLLVQGCSTHQGGFENIGM